MTCAPSEDAREPQSYLIRHPRAGGSSGRRGREGLWKGWPEQEGDGGDGGEGDWNGRDVCVTRSDRVQARRLHGRHRLVSRHVLSRPGVILTVSATHNLCRVCTGWWVALRVMTLNVVTGEVQG